MEHAICQAKDRPQRKHAELLLNLLGPEMVRDLVSLIQRGEADETCKSLCSRAPIPTISFLTSTRPLIRRNRAFLAIGLCPVVSSGPVVGGQFDMSTIENNRSWTHFRVDRRKARYCHVTFDHPPINTITATTFAELSNLVTVIEQDPELNVVVFDSVNPNFHLAHYDLENDVSKTTALGVGPTGLSAWVDVLVRLARAPVVGIASIRGRPAVPEASSCSPAICDSPLARTRFSDSGRSAWAWFLVAAQWRAFRGWSVAAGHSKSSSSPTISMDRAQSNTDTLIE